MVLSQSGHEAFCGKNFNMGDIFSETMKCVNVSKALSDLADDNFC